MAVLFDSPFFTALDATGASISGAKLKFFLAGTTTATPAYADRGLSTSLGSTVTADSAGRFPDIWLSDAINYKVQYTDAADVPIKTVDYAVQATSAAPASDSSATEWKSSVVNGGFDNWTSGTSFSNVSGSNAEVAIVDGWRFWQPGTASNAISRQTAASTPARFGLRFGRPAASVSTQPLRVGSLLPPELVYRLRGKKVVLSLVMQAGANFSAGSVSLTLATGTGTAEALAGITAGTWTGQAAPISAAQAVTVTATRYTFTATLDSNITEAGLVIAYSPTGTAGANDWVQLENVQLEVGEAATDFSARPAILDFVQAWDTTSFRTFLQGVSGGATYQPFDATLNALAGATTGADTLLYFSNTDVVANTTLTSFARTLLDDADQATARTTLGALASSSYTAADVLSKLLTVDGAGSGLDADLFRGLAPSAFAQLSAANTFTNTNQFDAQVTVALGSRVRWFEPGNNNYHGARTNSSNEWRVDYNGTDYLSLSSAGLLTLPNGGRIQAKVRALTTTSGTLVAADANSAGTLTGNITLPNSVFSDNDMQVFNAGDASRTFTRGTGIAMLLNGVNVASATLPANTIGGVYWRAANNAVLSGAFQ